MGKVGEASDDTLLGEVTVHVRWSLGERRPPVCADVASGYDFRPRRGSHLNAMQWKTCIEANVPQMNCLSCGVKQIRAAWAEDASRFTELFDAHVIDALKAMLRFNGDETLIVSGTQQLLQLCRILHRQLQQPTLAIWIPVEQRRILLH